MIFDNKKKSVFGIFDARLDLERAVDLLKARGFHGHDISVLLPSPEGSQNLAHEKASKAPEGAASGGAGGIFLGGALGWLAGAGLLAIPGIGPFVAAGPLLAALAGAGIGGTAGGIAGALLGFGIPEYEAKRYETVLKSGGMLLSVHAEGTDMVKIAEEVLETAGARDISYSGEERGVNTRLFRSTEEKYDSGFGKTGT